MKKYGLLLAFILVVSLPLVAFAINDVWDLDEVGGWSNSIHVPPHSSQDFVTSGFTLEKNGTDNFYVDVYFWFDYDDSGQYDGCYSNGFWELDVTWTDGVTDYTEGLAVYSCSADTTNSGSGVITFQKINLADGMEIVSAEVRNVRSESLSWQQQITDVEIRGDFIYAVSATPTPTPYPTPTPMAIECDWEAYDQMAGVEGYYFNPPLGYVDVKVTGAATNMALVFPLGETILIPASTDVEFDDVESLIGHTFYCAGGDCGALQFWYRPEFCLAYDLAEFEIDSAIDISYGTASCTDYHLDEFDLSSMGTVTWILDTFGITVPAIGWYESDIEICLQPAYIDKLELGGYDLMPFVTGLVVMLILVLVRMIRER